MNDKNKGTDDKVNRNMTHYIDKNKNTDRSLNNISPNDYNRRDNSNIIDSLMMQWDESFEDIWNNNAILTIKYLSGDYTIIHNTLRDYWESVKIGSGLVGSGQAVSMPAKVNNLTQTLIDNSVKCELDNHLTENNYFQYGNLLFHITKYPSLKYHLFAKVEEHRDIPIKEDFLSMMNFVRDFKYDAFINLRGSGASIPDHVHFQCQTRKHFPLLSKCSTNSIQKREIYSSKRYAVYIPDMPNYGWMFEFDETAHDEVSDLLIRVGSMIRSLSNANLSYNALFSKDRVLVFPRTKEYFTEVPAYMEGTGLDKWRIAGQEMGHLFTAKYIAILNNIDSALITKILADVTVNDIDNRKYLEDRLVALCITEK